MINHRAYEATEYVDGYTENKFPPRRLTSIETESRVSD